MKSARICLALIAALALAVPAVADHHETDHDGHAMNPAPDFELADQNGETHKLSDYRGKIVVLEWTSPECPFVKRHYADGHTTMIDLAQKFDDKDVVWLAIDSSHFATAESALKWAKEKGIRTPILLDADGEVGRLYDAKTTPHMFVVGREGELLYSGAIDDDSNGKGEAPVNYVEAAVSSALAGEPVQTARTTPYGCSVKYSKAKAKSASAS
jgi:peroxiredoxin